MLDTIIFVHLFALLELGQPLTPIPIAKPPLKRGQPIETSRPQAMGYFDELCGERLYAPFLKYKFLQVLILKSALSDHLWAPFALVASSPKGTLAGVLVVYFVIVLIWIPLKLVSLVVSEVGTYFILLGLFYWFGKNVALYLSFPGSFKTVQRDIEKEYSRRVLQKLDLATQSIANWAGDLQLGPEACGDPSNFTTRHAQALWFQQEVVIVLKNAIALVVDVGGDKVDDDGGTTKPFGMFLKLSPTAAAETSLLHSLLCEIDRLVTQLTPMADLLVNSSYRQRPSYHAKLILEMKFPPHQSTLKNVSTSAEEMLSAIQLTEALIISIGRLRLLAPRLKISSKDRGPLNCLYNMKEARNPITETCCSLPLMRAEVVTRFKARCFLHKFNPSSSSSSSPSSSSSSNGNESIGHSSESVIDICIIPANDIDGNDRSKKVNNKKPCVVFCNPNAGMYECSNMSPKCADWLEFYRNLDMQVVMFNYRGYGRSQGCPSPQANCEDCLGIVRYLRTTLGVQRIVVHGESIGGVCAAYVGAREGLVDLLIVDRTFANLGAVAQYLVGSWTVPALKVFTHWDTDVLKNYMIATCPKVCCSDVDDQIIAEPGSLKAAVACRLELGDVDVLRVSLDRDYALAELCDEPPPNHQVSGTSTTSLLLPRTHEPLTESQIQHFTQCLRYIAKTARKTSLMNKTGRSRSSSGASSNANHGDEEVNFEDVDESGGVKDDNEAGYTSKDAMMAQGSWGLNNPSIDDDGDWANISQEEKDDVEEGGANRPFTSSPLHSRTESHDNGIMEKVWLTLARCDGKCGQLLGQAVAKGLPWVRCWVCSLVVWHGNRLISSSVPGFDPGSDIRFLSIKAVSEQLDKFLTEEESFIREDVHIKYVSEMFHYLVHRIDSSSSEDKSQKDLLTKAGHLIPLHCGHNNPYSEEERMLLQHHITRAMVNWS